MTQSTPEAFAVRNDLAESTTQLLLGVVRTLVSFPDQVTASISREGGLTLIVITIAPEDLEKVLGKDGRTARSLKAATSARAASSEQHIDLELQAEREGA